MTTTATHTPGPWEFFAAPKVGSSGNCEIRTVGSVQHTPRFTGPMYIGCAYHQENARLMAAAPDLLAALKFALSEESDFACSESTEARLLAAIRKAEQG